MRGSSLTPRIITKSGNVMSTHLSGQSIENSAVRKVWNVSEFARRYRLDEKEENRLVKLLGPFASEHELLMNASRAPVYR